MQRIWLIWLGVASLLTGLYFGVPATLDSRLVLYGGLGTASIVLLLIGAQVNQATPRGPWLWFAAGLTSFVIADVVFHRLLLAQAVDPPVPSIADGFHLLMYPLMIVGLTKMVRGLRPAGATTGTAALIDAAIVATAMFGASWILFVDTVLAAGRTTDAALLTQLAYPAMDVALAAVAARLAVTLRLRHPPFALILLAVSSLAVADVGRGMYRAAGTYQAGTLVDGFWLAFSILFAAAALHPAVRSPGQARRLEDGLTGRQLTIMFFATLAVPLIDLFWGSDSDREVTIVASALLFLLILIRVLGLMRAVQRGQERLRYYAGHDSLTGLTNRVLFSERTAAALEKDGGGVAVLFIDLDDFKNINDSLGHAAGDTMLAEVADRLLGCVGPASTVARFGGDEFAVLLEGATERRSAVAVARRALEAVSHPIDLGSRTVRASASIGIALHDQSTADVESLLRNADVAMYLSKSRGKGRYEFFETDMHDEAIERLDLKADLQRAIDENQLILHYQPIFELRTGKVTLAEALIRWQHPTRGLVMPDRFIPMAEESGLIVGIGEWVLREACVQAASWQRFGGSDGIGVTVNLSMRQLQDEQLVASLTRALDESGLDPSKLVLEITESMLATDPERSTEILGQLKAVGVKLALDDFGTGYSSLSYLRSFPVDSIKIDRSFISELHQSSTTSMALIEAVVNLSRALGAYTVAEGIEYRDQAELLRKLGCDRGQGFYYCRPLAPAPLAALLEERLADELQPLDAWRRSSELVHKQAFEVRAHHGLATIGAMSGDIEALNRDLGVPVMASWPWLSCWAEAFRSWTPMMVEVRSARSGELAAYALLAYTRQADGTAIVAMGHGSSFHTSLPARDAPAASALAGAVAVTLEQMPGAWSLELEQLSGFDATAHQLADELAHAQLVAERRVPRVIFSTAHHVDEVLGRSMRRRLRQARSRIASDGRNMSIAFDRGQAISLRLIDEVEAMHVLRDRDTRRSSDLDRPSEREFWRQVLEATGDQWEVEIASLRLDDRLAAYVVGLLDGTAYRVYDGRMSTELAAYSPGRLIAAAALDRAMKDERFAVLDWMSGVAADKLLATNVTERRARLIATSASRSASLSSEPASSGAMAAAGDRQGRWT